jgi:hypothetical protein
MSEERIDARWAHQTAKRYHYNRSRIPAVLKQIKEAAEAGKMQTSVEKLAPFEQDALFTLGFRIDDGKTKVVITWGGG